MLSSFHYALFIICSNIVETIEQKTKNVDYFKLTKTPSYTQ